MNTPPQRVAVFCTGAVRSSVQHQIAAALGEDVRFFVGTRRDIDLARLTRRIERIEPRPQAAIVFVPERPGAPQSWTLPMVVSGVVVGTLPYTSIRQIVCWLRTLGSKPFDRTLIAAMQKPLYVSWARRIGRALRRVRPPSTVRVRLPATTSAAERASSREASGCASTPVTAAAVAGVGTGACVSRIFGAPWTSVREEAVRAGEAQ